MNQSPDPRLDAIFEVLLAFARQDFSKHAPVSSQLDAVDAIAVGLNMLAEELNGAVASKRELESAYLALRDTQAKLVHAGKLAAIGQLASGVAHEINNPASWVILTLSAMQQQLGELRELVGAGTPEQRERAQVGLTQFEGLLANAREGMDRIRAVAGDLRTFSRADGDEQEPLSLNEVVQAACNLAGPALRERARITVKLGNPPRVLGNRGRLGQVVTNLLVNASQALPSPARPEDEIFIETREEDGRALLAVEDTGPGVEPELRERVFEPFFTTKPAAMGTGLGLSLVSAIVRSHRGTVRIDSGRSGGARFEVLLPAATGVAETPPPPSDMPVSRRIRMLIVDDEPRLLRSYGLLLSADHDVFLAEGGQAALDHLAKDKDVDVVLCDLQMPGMDGVTFFERLNQLAPALAPKVIFSTGGAYQPHVKAFLASRRFPVLEKPVRVEELLSIVARMIQPAPP